jgi:phosphonate transport system substrate-binding protein
MHVTSLSFIQSVRCGVMMVVASWMLAFGAFTSAQAQQVFRVTTIPEEVATEQIRKFTPLAAYLEKQLGVKVEFTPVSDYPAAVEAMVNKKVDLVWFGGFTFVQASLRSGGKVVPLAQMAHM